MTEIAVAEERPLDDVLDQRQVFDEERRNGIFSTDTAAILGLSRYGSPLSVYRAKIGEGGQRAQSSLAAWLGSNLEPLLSEMYAHATGTRVRADNLAHFHKQYHWLATHLDRRAIGDPGLIVELKTRASSRGWGDDGSSDIPADVWTQVQHQMFVLGARQCHVAALFGNSSFRVYHIEPDPSFEAEILPTLSEFWHDHVLLRVPPLASGAEVDTEYLSGLGGGDTGYMKPATPEMEEVVDQFRIAYYNAASALHAKVELANRIKVLIGEEADGLTGTFGVITWKRTRPSTKTEWKLLAGTYRAAADRLLELAAPIEDDVPEYATLQATVETAESLYSREVLGVRRFVPDFVDA